MISQYFTYITNKRSKLSIIALVCQIQLASPHRRSVMWKDPSRELFTLLVFLPKPRGPLVLDTATDAWVGCIISDTATDAWVGCIISDTATHTTSQVDSPHKRPVMWGNLSWDFLQLFLLASREPTYLSCSNLAPAEGGVAWGPHISTVKTILFKSNIPTHLARYPGGIYDLSWP